MIETLRRIWRTPDLRNDILFVIAMLVIFRILAHVPIPGVDQANLKVFFEKNQFLGLINIFSGGGIENFSIVALGVAPYITSSIIFQLLAMVVPKLEELAKEGEYGRAKINQYTRLLTVPLAMLQAVGLITLLRSSSQGGAPILPTTIDTLTYATIVLTMAAGTILLMWIGELISERKIGNGISLLIFAGIVAGLPGTVQRTWLLLSSPTGGIDTTQLMNLVIFAVIAVVTIVGVVFITEAQRKVPVSYAKRVRGNRMYGGVDTYLPLRVNQAGVIPIIFAISVILFPPLVAQFFTGASTVWIASMANWFIRVFQNQTFYAVSYFVLVFIFTYFYTAVVFQPQQIAENLQKQGGFIPGIRPGQPTAGYLSYTINRIIFAGALFLGVIAVLPLVVQRATGISTLAVGGTSLLIVVSVVIETIQQIQAQLVMRDYEEI
ncbi:preprotein translocase subunit SecY [Candidatus Uhrbacteria bacterium RIFCSPLOWO2_12_FULL_46_10]|uniref:Protein translocase subunit SecY n=1 Tax=Candidatus Uhrbacteria bacterium RIFCSPLOWO2_01_FULL_47_25 TaxID=1802402 RepID=A0A1F7UWW9_9BACT|nr:MAG: Protein translocase subunit SecY [Parcubacteria group bacterium GW2011_GWA2_46_9]OGL59126.1 MAG: preprotein translocase subunit SecY [Candidatus Uhrbacteria bacterium RIFCSPHIGHO2_01_FULL_46_23]OGL70254.1 MAG: preprotein translocase subunit SecY [Candidatus Uhrbacteria bacterium RIFCSPHIGHO2_02_FULL_47_29]OGL74674.1 MAG: preprotein translocase subunit SecY [Candidatus Uhrbacteria bacterium RIFCSPHIGHO2_12_FULL_46_13]OGL82791.1 MAG: preprotein translocase subunit SecY [Candidatus Uhrbact